MQNNVAIIGGGIAGLTSAAILASNGVNVTLYEANPYLGGRARGLTWKGTTLDNGQHIILGAYHQTLSLLSKLGIHEEEVLLRIPLQIHMQDVYSLHANSLLPAPFHLLYGILLAKGLSLKERLSAILFMHRLQKIDYQLDQDITLLSLLKKQNQPSRLIKTLWEPICLAALNTPPYLASAQVFLNVLKDSFSKAKNDSDMLLPKVDLTKMISEPLALMIKNNGGKIHIKSAIKSISRIENGFCLATENTTGSLYQFIVIATSPHKTNELLAGLAGTESIQAMINKLRFQPIYTAYFQFEKDVNLPQAMIGYSSGYCQWSFDRGTICGQHGLIAVVISAEGKHQEISHESLAKAVLEELQAHHPNLGEPQWTKIIAEKRATFACSPRLARPDAITMIPNLYLAGDYTQGKYPATIEGAVQSGVECAHYILKSR